MNKLITSLAALTALAALPLAAQEGDDFFNDATVEAPPAAPDAPPPDEVLDKESLTLTGNIDASGSYTVTRDFLWGLADLDDNALSYILTGDFLVDARLRQGFRAFADINIGYSNVGMAVMHNYNLLSPIVGTVVLTGDTVVIPPGTLIYVSEDQSMLIGIKELFIDFNIANAVYFRVGKQVLQWGRGYLWNPTDMINLEKKSFLDMGLLRQGNFGLRTDFVFDRAFHLFTYVQFEGAEDFSDMAVAGKAEFLIGSVETSLSAWWKGGQIPVFGWDISAPLFWDINCHAEAAVSWGDNLDKMDTAGGVYQIRDQLVTRVSAGFSKGFTVDNDDNRVIVNTEFYYNSSGYDENMFEALNSLPDVAPTYQRTQALTTFLGSNYDTGNYGKFYGMLALTVNKFLANQLTFTLSGIGNFSDSSFMAVADLSYAPVYNFTINFKLLSYIGLNYREYTVSPSITSTSVTLGHNMFGANLSCSVKF